MKKISQLLNFLISFLFLILSVSPVFATYLDECIKNCQGIPGSGSGCIEGCKNAAAGNLGLIQGMGGFLPDLTKQGEGVGSTLEKVMSMLLAFFTILGGLMFIIFFLLGALSWLSAAGKQEQLQKAQNQITNALIGLVIVVASYTAFFIVGKILGLNLLNPAETLMLLNPTL